MTDVNWGKTPVDDITGPTPGSPPDGTVDVNDLNAVFVGWGACP